jgi:MraZ protein
MDRYVSTFTNKIDAKGRVSIPAPFRAILERDGYRGGGGGGGIYCYPSLDAPALDAGGERLAKKIDGLLGGLPDYSDERDELSVALYGDVQVLAVDGDGRIVLPEALRAHAGLSTSVAFVGLGDKFQMWEPGRFEQRRRSAREKVRDTRKLLGQAGAAPLTEPAPAPAASPPSPPLTGGPVGSDMPE